MNAVRSFVARRKDAEEGFTLIELMVVVLIIAILIAIAIPQFLGARSRAQDRAAQSDLRNALTAEKTVYVDNQTYSNDTAAGGLMVTTESSLNWGGVKSATRPLNVGVLTNNVANDTVCLSEQSASGAWFGIGDIATASATQAAGTFFKKNATDPCAAATVATIGGWASSF